jgi:hypothetical protein
VDAVTGSQLDTQERDWSAWDAWATRIVARELEAERALMIDALGCALARGDRRCRRRIEGRVASAARRREGRHRAASMAEAHRCRLRCSRPGSPCASPSCGCSPPGPRVPRSTAVTRRRCRCSPLRRRPSANTVPAGALIAVARYPVALLAGKPAVAHPRRNLGHPRGDSPSPLISLRFDGGRGADRKN